MELWRMKVGASGAQIGNKRLYRLIARKSLDKDASVKLVVEPSLSHPITFSHFYRAINSIGAAQNAPRANEKGAFSLHNLYVYT